MPWKDFKKSVLDVVSDPSKVSNIDMVAQAYAEAYDTAIKSGYDKKHKIKLKKGNTALLKQLFKAAFEKGLTSQEPYDLVGELGNGVLAYWQGAIMEITPEPSQPAIGATKNIKVVSNIVTTPGVWPIPSSGGLEKKIQEEIKEQKQEQTTPKDEESLGNRKEETIKEGEVIKADEVNSQIDALEGEDINETEELKDEIDLREKRTITRGSGNTSRTGGGGGPDPEVKIDNLNFKGTWVELAVQYISGVEGMTKCATWDENAYRLGYGSDKFLQSDGSIRKVRAGDCTTKEDAKKVLTYELGVDYLKRLIGSGARQISKSNFDTLTSSQKAACMSMVYNVGSLTKSVAAAIRSNQYALAVTAFKNGPVTGAGSGKVYPGLVKRRNEEAALFQKGMSA